MQAPGAYICACRPRQPILALLSMPPPWPWTSISILRPSQPRSSQFPQPAAIGRAAGGLRTTSSWRFTKGCWRAMGGRLCLWRFAWSTAFHWGWAAVRRRRDGWRLSPWRFTLANLAGAPNAFSKRPAFWKGIRTTPRPVGWAGLRSSPARAGACMWPESSRRPIGGPSSCCPRSH